MFTVFELLITICCYFEIDYFQWWELLFLPAIILIVWVGIIIFIGSKYGMTKNEQPRSTFTIKN